MQKKALTLLLVIISLQAFSQSYIPINIDTSCYWVSKYGFYWGTSYKVTGEMTSKVEKDTLILGKTYFKIVTYPSAIPVVYDSMYLNQYLDIRTAYIREDTILKKVFQFNNITASDTTALDFNLNTGDTLPMLSYQITFLVDSVSYINVLGVTRRAQHSGFLNYLPHYITLEGIGATSNFPATGHGSFGIPEFDLKCFVRNGVKLFGDTVSNCIRATPLSVFQINESKVSWNYADSRLVIHNTENEKLRIRVISPHGAVLFEDNITSSFYTKNFESFAVGVYVLQFTGAKTNSTKKILIK